MSNSILKFSLFLIGWLVLFSVATPDARRDVRAQERTQKSITIQSARARWEALSSEEQSQLKRRFKHLQKLDSEDRERLEKRARRHRELEGRALRQLSSAQYSRLMKLPSVQRQDVVDELVKQDRRNKGLRIESKLPRETREWLKNAPPKQRLARLEAFKQETRQRISARAVEGLAKSLGYGQAEVRRLELLPLGERMAVVVRLRKTLTAQQLKEQGQAEALTREEWDKLEAMPPEDYMREVWRLQSRGVLPQVPLPDQGQPSTRRGRESRFSREVRKAMRVQPETLLAMSGMSRGERRQATQACRRKQVFETLQDKDLVEPEELVSLTGLGDPAFLARVRLLAERSLEQGPKGPAGKRRDRPDRSR